MSHGTCVWIRHVTYVGATTRPPAAPPSSARAVAPTHQWVMARVNESWHIWISYGRYGWVMAHMNMSWHIHLYISIHLYIYLYMHKCGYIFIYICIYIHTSWSKRTPARPSESVGIYILWTHIYTHTNNYIYMSIYIYLNIYMHLYICTYLYMYSYIYVGTCSYICIYI